MTIEQEHYEERIIVFIDILGFKNHINQTVQDPSFFVKMQNVLNYLSKLKHDNDNGILAQKEIGREVTVFSDSIVVSYPINLPGSVFYLLLDIVHLQLEMLSYGILMRGGVTVGKLCHDDNIVYGPAMIEAYELESNVAVYPRVVVDKKSFEAAIQYPLNPPKQELEHISDLINEDFDGQYYVDFISQWQEVEDQDDYFKALGTIKIIIENAIHDYQSKPAILVKYQWLKKYFNSVLNNLKPEFTEGLYIK
ncbi:hypothetical protein [Bacillus mycoides]|uniref:hypothetical protein n=1 Tax=Bacillus mycoides TaxID=1405 RepID=UPI00073E2B02|nr:hypothetical protein [Bacillus mycoides]KUH41411.1 hypothetical protein M2E15_1502 [Bacillus mycoides]MED1018770.1 hypothetical protein [Bacillus mycoides]